ncbi:Long-chain-fatty-acid--CoA ligase 4 [Blomia tropicalis]|nr:Long-chain-fatty-acid--CoA ligase 4 [Blomia tropicalis]
MDTENVYVSELIPDTREKPIEKKSATIDNGTNKPLLRRRRETEASRSSGEKITLPKIDGENINCSTNTNNIADNIAKSHTPLQLGQCLKMAGSILVKTFMGLFVTIVEMYTLVTLPVYFLIQKPWIRRRKSERNRVKIQNPPLIEEDKSMSAIFVRDVVIKQLHEIIHLDTVTEMLDKLPQFVGGKKNALGYRQILSEEISLDQQGNARRIDGRQLKRYRLSEYKWLTYDQVDFLSRSVAQAMFSKGIASSDKVLIISETRVEWMICAHAIIRTGATIVTLFSNLGLDGICHGIMETQASTVIASIDCLPLLEKVLEREGHSVKRLIYIDGYNKPNLDRIDPSIETYSLSNLEEEGKRAVQDGIVRPLFKADPDHLMLIMYTSGTTDIIDEAPIHRYISYLPMAHVLELTVESFFFFGGVEIGYASPFTLTDSAPGLASDQKCDIKLLKPTVITAVPLVLDRILKEVNEKLRARTPISQPIFKYLMEYKSRWTRRGYKCNIVRRLLCSKVQEQLGGNLSYMVVGGAPLDSQVQATIKSALDLTLIHGYGATETTGAVMAMDFDDLEYGGVGAPLGGVKLRLKDWHEGNYSCKDIPHPRGEIIIGGGSIVKGYYKLPEQSEEAFYTDRDGTRWFRTGDIGLMYPNGTIKIIDRRKDLIKLQNGEYISLGKVESALKTSQYVDNICVYGGPFSNHLVALISPNKKSLNQLVAKLGKQYMQTMNDICDDNEVEQEIYEEIIIAAKTAGLGKKEIPLRIKVVPDEWTPDNGILTAALKLKRKTIEINYHKLIEQLYSEDHDYNGIINKRINKNHKKIAINDSMVKSSDTNNNNIGMNRTNQFNGLSDRTVNGNVEHTNIEIHSV